MKKIKKLLYLLIALIIAVIIIGLSYSYYSYRSFINNNDTFPENTTINLVDCSNCTPTKSVTILTDAWNKKHIDIYENSKPIGSINNFELNYNIKNEIFSLLHPDFKDFMFKYFLKSKLVFNINMNPEGISDSIEAQTKEMPFANSIPGNFTPNNNAYIDTSTFDYKIVKEEYGDEIDHSKFNDAILESISKGEFKFDYEQDKYYKTPEITSKNKRLLEKQQYYIDHYYQKITYILGDSDVLVTPKELMTMVSYPNDEYTVNTEAVVAFVAEFSAKNDTQGITRTLNTPGSGTFTVYGGDFGYRTNQYLEAQQLTEDLKSKKDVKRKPIYKHISYVPINQDIGDTYVDINLSRQHLWFVKDGSSLFDCNVVTGNISSSHTTPQGTYGLTYKQSPATLKGDNADGTKYESIVNWWMPFNGDVGMHDAPWRSEFGGSIYKTNGSHGCINMPPAYAKKIYPYMEPGTPIIVHY